MLLMYTISGGFLSLNLGSLLFYEEGVFWSYQNKAKKYMDHLFKVAMLRDDDVIYRGQGREYVDNLEESFSQLAF
jgi:hypothetical protein